MLQLKNATYTIIAFVVFSSFSNLLFAQEGDEVLVAPPPWIYNGTHIHNNNSGNVGIGSTTPLALLEIRGTPGKILLSNSAGTPAIGTVLGQITFRNTSFGYDNAHIYAVTDAGWGGADYPTALTFFTTPNNSPTAVERMRISNDGNVGIGTTNPSTKLNIVEGDIKINAITTNKSLILDAVSTVNLSTLISHRRDNILRWQYGANGNLGTDDLEFFRYDNTGAFLGTVLRLERSTGNSIFNGNVGIGTSDPGTNKLAVNGTIKAKEVIVSMKGWSDFVFEDDYDLMELEELESFIELNGHLPEIPKSADVEENGIELGKMQSKLLQKIEELTLYMIELKKENSSLQEELVKIKESLSY